MIFIVTGILFMALGVPASMFGYMAFLGCCLPFFADSLVNGIWLGSGQATQGRATVEVIHEDSYYVN